MTIGSDIVFRNGLDVFGAIVGAVPAGDWDAPSPCAGWTALDVLGHLGSSVSFGVSILEDRTNDRPTADRPADLVVDEPADYWTGIAASARTALVDADLDAVRDTRMDSRSVAHGLAFPGIDLYVHSWDIGRAVGIDWSFPGTSSSSPTATSIRSPRSGCVGRTARSAPRWTHRRTPHRRRRSSPGPAGCPAARRAERAADLTDAAEPRRRC